MKVVAARATGSSAVRLYPIDEAGLWKGDRLGRAPGRPAPPRRRPAGAVRGPDGRRTGGGTRMIARIQARNVGLLPAPRGGLGGRPARLPRREPPGHDDRAARRRAGGRRSTWAGPRQGRGRDGLTAGRFPAGATGPAGRPRRAGWGAGRRGLGQRGGGEPAHRDGCGGGDAAGGDVGGDVAVDVGVLCMSASGARCDLVHRRYGRGPSALIGGECPTWAAAVPIRARGAYLWPARGAARCA